MPSSTSSTPATLAYLLLRAATPARKIIHREETQDAADYDAASCLLTALAHALQVGAATPDQLAQLGQMAPRPWDLLRQLADQLEAAGLLVGQTEDVSVVVTEDGPAAGVRLTLSAGASVMDRIGGFTHLGPIEGFDGDWHQRRLGRTLILAPVARAVR